jgi:hypothetical protein
MSWKKYLTICNTIFIFIRIISLRFHISHYRSNAWAFPWYNFLKVIPLFLPPSRPSAVRPASLILSLPSVARLTRSHPAVHSYVACLRLRSRSASTTSTPPHGFGAASVSDSLRRLFSSVPAPAARASPPLLPMALVLLQC